MQILLLYSKLILTSFLLYKTINNDNANDRTLLVDEILKPLLNVRDKLMLGCVTETSHSYFPMSEVTSGVNIRYTMESPIPSV